MVLISEVIANALQQNVGITHYICVATILFVIGIAGVLQGRKSFISILISLELILLAININFVAFSSFLHDIQGQIFSLFILTVAAAESAIGLAIVVVYYRNRRTINIDQINEMRG